MAVDTTAHPVVNKPETWLSSLISHFPHFLPSVLSFLQFYFLSVPQICLCSFICSYYHYSGRSYLTHLALGFDIESRGDLYF